MASTLSVGLPLTEALRCARKVCRNVYFKEALSGVSREVIQGASLTDAFAANLKLPAYVLALVEVGEAAGVMEEVLGRASVMLDSEVEEASERMVATGEAAIEATSSTVGTLLVDRATGRVAFVVSTEGGMDIEAVAHDTPEKITTFSIDPAQGFMPHHGRAVAFALKLKGDLNKQAQKLSKQLYDAFVATDCSMLEINPLVETEDGNLTVLDAKMSFDSNALYRHPAIEALRDETEEDPAEVEASEYDLAYIKLDGNIGCMVNGAGLAMATMDIIKLNGAFPANFLDVGGGATTEKVTAAFKIILKDPAVEGILVNIFGGIMKCDVIANGIVQAAKDVNLSVPLVVRLEGTNVEEGKAILDNSGLAIVSADDLGDAAKKIVAEVKQAA